MQSSLFTAVPGVPESAHDRMMAAIHAAAARAKDEQRAELRRMRQSGMFFVEQLKLSAQRRLSPEAEVVLVKRSKGIIRDFCNVARAVRQVLILEQELEGIRPSWRKTKTRLLIRPLRLPPLPSPFGKLPDIDVGPLPDDLADDYDTRPVGEAVAFIRETLGLDAPADDPFPPPRLRPVAAAKPPEPGPTVAESSEIPAKPAPRKPARALPVSDLPIDRDLGPGPAIIVRRAPPRPHSPPRGPPWAGDLSDERRILTRF